MPAELLAVLQGLLDIAVDVKKGLKSGGVLEALLTDADLLAKAEVVAANLGKLGGDVKALNAAEVVQLVVQVVVPGIEAVIQA